MEKQTTMEVEEAQIKLQYGQELLKTTKLTCASALAVCELCRPTLLGIDSEPSYMTLGVTELRQRLDDHDLMLHQAADLLQLLTEKLMDMDETTSSLEDSLATARRALAPTPWPKPMVQDSQQVSQGD